MRCPHCDSVRERGDLIYDYVANIYKGAEAQIEWEQCAYPFPREMEADGILAAFAGAFNILKADGSKIN